MSRDDGPPEEPTDEDIWLAGIAQRVETDARPLFASVWVWLLERALQLDEDERALQLDEDEPAG